MTAENFKAMQIVKNDLCMSGLVELTGGNGNIQGSKGNSPLPLPSSSLPLSPSLPPSFLFFLPTVQIRFQLCDHETKLKLKSMPTVTTVVLQEQGDCLGFTPFLGGKANSHILHTTAFQGADVCREPKTFLLREKKNPPVV